MILIDTVYQKVLTFANKEQRGYITPQEFNLFADIAQMDIFEQYFHDLGKTTQKLGNHKNHTDEGVNINSKISLFQRYTVPITAVNEWGNMFLGDLNVYRLGVVMAQYATQTRSVVVTPFDIKDAPRYNTPLTKSSGIAGPRYYEYYAGDNTLRIKVNPYPTAADQVTVSYIEKPAPPSWTYFISSTGAALYNPDANDHQNFQLHASEENDLVIKILQLAGISIKDYQLAGAAAQQEAKKIQQENK